MIARPESRQPLPADARCVFRGQLFDVYQWSQKLYDGTQVTFEKLRRPDTCYVIPIIDSSRVLIVRQEQPGSRPYIGLIGGRISVGESPDDAARRELREESGLSTEKLEFWESYQFLPKIDWAIYVFIARECRQLGRALDGGEKIELVTVDFDELIRLAATEAFGDVEVALRLLRVAANPELSEVTRHKLFGPAQ
jgi:ADP-ribose pyrophosphatase